jgi:hypothetical protein
LLLKEVLYFKFLILAQKRTANDDEAKDEKGFSDDSIVPEFIVSLEASDDFIKDRIMNLPEANIADTKNSEEGTLYISLYKA